jgi:predicted aspartyl protease
MRRAALLPILLVVSLAHTPETHAQTQSTSARQILEQVRLATGGDAWNHVAECVSDGTFQVDVQGQEHSGTIHYAENLRTGANALIVDMASAHFHRTSGDHPDGSWSLDASGDVQVDPSHPDWQIDDLYFTRIGFLRTNFAGAKINLLTPQSAGGVLFDRLRVQPAGGTASTLWINHQTHRIERRESGDSTRVYYDYRRVQGVLIPFAERNTGGQRQIIVWGRRRLLTRTDHATDIPFHHDYSMPASGSVTVPAGNGLIFAIAINGKGPFQALLDTGSDNLLTDSFARRLGLHLNSDAQPFGAGGGSITARTTYIDTLRIGGLTLRHQLFYVIQPAEDIADEVPMVVLGYETLRRFAIGIDPNRNQITFTDGAKFRPADRGVRVPLTLAGHGILADGAVNGAPARFVLDTGNEFAFELDSDYVQQNHLVEATHAHYRGYAGSGYAGASPEAWIARLDTVNLGDATAHHVVADLSTGDATGGGIAGNLGQSVLLQFTSTWDVIRSALYLEKNSRWNRPEVFNRAGLITEPDNGGQRIRTVFPDSPGASAGLVPGDLIVKIDGAAPPDDLIIPAFLQPPGTVVHLTVQHGNQAREVEVTLREIL